MEIAHATHRATARRRGRVNLELLSAVVFGGMIGVAVGWWRCLVYCRKLRHFGIDLDRWAQYDPAVEQARRNAEGPVPRAVTGPRV